MAGLYRRGRERNRKLTDPANITAKMADTNAVMVMVYITAASLVHELIEARDEKRLLRYQKSLASHSMLWVIKNSIRSGINHLLRCASLPALSISPGTIAV